MLYQYLLYESLFKFIETGNMPFFCKLYLITSVEIIKGSDIIYVQLNEPSLVIKYVS